MNRCWRLQLDVLRARLQHAPVDAGIAPVPLQIHLVLPSQVPHLRSPHRTIHLQMIPVWLSLCLLLFCFPSSPSTRESKEGFFEILFCLVCVCVCVCVGVWVCLRIDDEMESSGKNPERPFRILSKIPKECFCNDSRILGGPPKESCIVLLCFVECDCYSVDVIRAIKCNL